VRKNARKRERKTTGEMEETGYVEESEDEREVEDENGEIDFVVSEDVLRNGVLTPLVEESVKYPSMQYRLTKHNLQQTLNKSEVEFWKKSKHHFLAR
jgi:hypothetical protein